jgi:hypothetical protein
MIGRFKDAREAAKTKQVIEWLTEQINADVQAGLIEIGSPADRYTDKMLDYLRGIEVYSIGPPELEQFGYDFTIEIDDDKVIITTEEIDVSAFLKVLLNKGARVEVYSAHHYSGTGYGR